MKGSKKIHLEVIRVIALVCIIYNHTGERGNSLYMFTNGDVTFVLSLIADILCKIGVPLFLMVSGALLLPKEESLQEIYSKRVLRIIKVIILFTMIRYCYECFWVKKMAFSILGLIELIFTGKLFVPYWFLYAYLSILLVLPFLKKMVKNMDKKEMHIITLLILVFYALMPVISAVFNLNFEISFVFGVTCCYCILGYYLEDVISEDMYTRKNTLWAVMIVVVSIVLSYWLVTKDRRTLGGVADEYSSVLSCFIAFCIFFIIKAIWGNAAEKRKNIVIDKSIIVIGSCSFGIYLIEDYLRNGLSIICDTIAPYTTILPACAVWLTAVIMLCVVIVSVLKKIPGLKEIL